MVTIQTTSNSILKRAKIIGDFNRIPNLYDIGYRTRKELCIPAEFLGGGDASERSRIGQKLLGLSQTHIIVIGLIYSHTKKDTPITLKELLQYDHALKGTLINILDDLIERNLIEEIELTDNFRYNFNLEYEPDRLRKTKVY